MGTPKGTQAVIAEYREENKRLRLVNADMLEALKCIMESNTAFPDVYMPKVRAAIAKATREPEK